MVNDRPAFREETLYALTRAYRVRPDCEAGLSYKYFVKNKTKHPGEVELSREYQRHRLGERKK